MTMLAPQPRYRQLAQTLINEIESGRYPVGDLLPMEFKLFCARPMKTGKRAIGGRRSARASTEFKRRLAYPQRRPQ